MVDEHDGPQSDDLPADDSTAAPEGDEPDEAELNEAQRQLAEAAQAVDFVVLPLACTNEGKGAPLAMGLQRWWAQELTRQGGQAAAPVFTAMREQDNRQVPALMVYREPWKTEQIREGVARFPNAKRVLVADFHVSDDHLKLEARLADVEPEAFSDLQTWTIETSAEELPAKLFEFVQEVAARNGHVLEHKTWQESFGTEHKQAVLSFLVGLGNLSALQGRCVPTTSDQLLNPLMDAVNRAPEMDGAMEALHGMVDILVGIQPDKAAVPLSVQALNIAAQRREKDPAAAHHLGMLLRRLGDLPSAANAFNRAFNLQPTDPAIATGFIDTLRTLGDSANALKVAEFALERGNEAPGLLGLYGHLLIEDDKFDEAEPFLRRAIDEGQVAGAYGDLANVLWDRADSDSDSGKEDREEALGLLRAAVQQSAIAKTTLDMLLDLHEEEGLADATKLLLEAAERHPQSPLVLTAVANMYLDGDAPEKAKPHLEQILKLPRRSLDDEAFARRGLLTLTVDEFEERYDAAVASIQGGNAEAQGKAAIFMREVIQKDPRFWQPHMMLALAVRGTEGDAAALAHLNTAVKLRPNDAEIRTLLAAILRKQGRPAEAVEHLRVVVALNPRDIEPVQNLARCMRDANLFDEARAVCETALKMVPGNKDFQAILDGLPPPREEQN
ncbi:MAG: tetratricopeptide repeat protein [Myxococcales bacterium FL481]|nr:MAG: tetratricopeptide repeat protein [Myxococcales bacterium FL481]